MIREIIAAAMVAVLPAPAAPDAAVGQQVAVPAYFYPGGDTAGLWERFSAPGTGIVVANPFSGPGKTRDPAYAAAISAARANGVRVLGYVPTGYLGTTGRQTRLGETTAAAWSAQVQQDVETWYRLYGGDGLGGVFFDEVQNVCGDRDAYATTYRELDRHTKAWHRGAFTVINPGITTEECYADVGDVILTFEGTYESYVDWQPPAWHRTLDPRRLWHLVHGTATEERLDEALRLSKRRNAGYVYVTPDVMANPWDTLPPPSYWDRELAGLATGDHTPPRVPGTPRATRVSATEVALAWPPVREAVGYDVLLDGVRVVGVSTPKATLRDLDPAHRYRISVVAVDRAGNASAPSRALTVTTARPDRRPPASPANVRAAETGVAHVRLAWDAVTDAVAYDVYINGSRLLTVMTPGVPVSGLEPSTGYAFTVVARDRTGNASAPSAPLAVTTTTPVGDPITNPGGAIGATEVTYEATYTLPFDFHHVFVDTDNDAATGFVTGDIGADLLIENGWFYRHTGTGWNWTPVDGPSPLVSTVDGHYVWRIPVAMAPAPHRVVFHGAGGSPDYSTTSIPIG
ncbi:hypothetical protein Val02_51100 [Virgisporangium aliadipatigenens]|uniref:Fibronectin type-III domain-containing protein n=1 Tax=Virgisporangium aliadipatigenens TaxID=741659 RepID=A0A8J3YMG1_9ACTN|nr:spherulation-specific family 4 protein [Virgisporangium aliadipatigenens]GIJ48224.1 hypothetical protein Val02_51100 [Virgisporangium aliadipatigenens]